jgi:signal peptidase I
MRQVYRVGCSLWQKAPVRWLGTVLMAALVGIAAGRTVLGSFGSVCVVDGESMVPTYGPGARVYTTPISSPLERGDVVLVNDGQSEYALKRVIGLPGETVHLWRGYVFLNRRLLREPYLPRLTYTFPDQRTETLAFHLSADQYFVLGDNRVCSVDSRRYGPVNREQLKGRVPAPDGPLQAYLDCYTLPAEGKRTIRHL